MKKLIVLLFGALAVVSCQNNNVIEITTKNIPDDTKVEIMSRKVGENELYAMAEGVVVEGVVKLDNPFEEVDEAYLAIKKEGYENAISFFIGEPGKIEIAYDLLNPDDMKTGGAMNNVKLQKLQDAVKPAVSKVMDFVDSNVMGLMELSNGAKSPELDQLYVEYQALIEAPQKIVEEFELANDRTAIGLILLYKKIGKEEHGIGDLSEEFAKYPSDLKKSRLGQKVEELLTKPEEQAGLTLGAKLPDFKALTPEGTELTLNSFLADKKLVLVDVWAAWCGPCRQENPNIVQAYETYKDQGFDIIGYSLDREEASWKKAIEVDKLTWTQVSNLKYWEDPIVEAYGLQGIPASYLVDANGTILAMNLRGEELSIKIEELLGNN